MEEMGQLTLFHGGGNGKVLSASAHARKQARAVNNTPPIGREKWVPIFSRTQLKVNSIARKEKEDVSRTFQPSPFRAYAHARTKGARAHT